VNGASSADARSAGSAGIALRAAVSEAAAWIERESLWLQLLAAWLLVLAMRLPQLVGIDTWLALVAGREIERGGLPHVETLTAWGSGEPWVDQQWLGHVVIYGLHSAGGLRLALLVNVMLLVATLAVVLVLARRLGASPRSTAVGGLLCILAAAESTSIRTQTLAQALFAVLLWLVLLDRNASPRRLLAVLGLLVVWANLHGSVLLAAGIVSLHGLAQIAEALWARRRPSAVSIVAAVGAPLTVLASPYGGSLVGYYRGTVGNDFFPTLLDEWRPPTLPGDWRFFLVAAIASWLVVRHGGRLSLTARLAFGVLLLGALLATRNVAWFALLTAAVVPVALDAAWPPAATGAPRRALAIAWGVLLLAVAAIVPAAFTRDSEQYEKGHPRAALASVAQALEDDPSLRILAGERFADWLLWKVPAAAGRVAFDARFEILPRSRLEDVGDFSWATEGWDRLLARHRLVVLERARHVRQEELLRDRGSKLLYGDDAVAVFLVP
jgi:hypothetical protein